jgi:hypothetical protein
MFTGKGGDNGAMGYPGQAATVLGDHPMAGRVPVGPRRLQSRTSRTIGDATMDTLRSASLIAFAWLTVATAAEPTIISNPGARATAVELAVDSEGAVNLVWIERSATVPGEASRGGAGADLWFARSGAGDSTFTPPTRVNPDQGAAWGFPVARPRVAVGNGGIIHVFYAGYVTEPASGIRVVVPLYSRSTDQGRSFGNPAVLGGTPAGIVADDPVNGESFGTLASDGQDGVSAYWIETRGSPAGTTDGRLLAVASTDGGRSFGPAVAALAAGVCPCCQPTALAADGRIYLGTREMLANGTRDSTVALSADGGRSFGPRVPTGGAPWTIDACPMKATALASDGRVVYAAAFDGGSPTPGAYVSRSTDGGRTFGNAVALHPGAAVADAPVLAVLRRKVVAAWHAKADSSSDRRVYLAVSRDRGRTFSPPAAVPASTGPAGYPAVARRRDGLQLAWQQGDTIVTRFLSSTDALLD